MTKPFEFHGVEAEKAEAMRRFNNRKSFRNILRFAAVASLCYLWFPTVAISLQAAGDWFYRTGSFLITDRSVVFFLANLIVALIFLLSGESNNTNDSSSNTEPEPKPDLYDQYTSSSTALVVTASSSGEKVMEEEEEEDEDDSNKQIVPAFIEEVEKEVIVDQANEDAVTTKGVYRRTKSETKKEISRPVTEFRRTESAKVVAMERLSSEEFRLKVESFIMERKRSLIKENDVVQFQGLGSIRPGGLIGATASSGLWLVLASNPDKLHILL